MARKKKTISPEGYVKASANAKEVRNKRAIESALRGIKSDTYDAGMRYVGGAGGKKAPFVPDEMYRGSLPTGMNPDDYRTAAKYAKVHTMEATGGKAAKVHPWVIEGYRNDALRARDAGDLESAKKLADAISYFEIAKRLDKMDGGGGGYRPQRQSRGGQQQPQMGRAGKSKSGKPQSGDGWKDPEESNPLKRYAGMILGNKGVQTVLKGMRTPYSYVASHVSDVAQELEEGSVGGAVGALGRGVGLGVVGEAADAVKGKGFDVAGILNSYENEKNRKDFWKQTGVGEYLQRGLDKHTWDDDTILNNKWTKRTIGLGGDFGLDPLTYLTGGTTKLTGSGAQVATRITEAGSQLAAKAGAEAAAKGLSKELAEEAVMTWAKGKAAAVIKDGKRVLTKKDIQRLFPDEQVAGGLAFRVPGTGRVSKTVVGGLTGGKVVPEEKLIPLLSKNVTNPMQRVLSKPARALGASKMANKASGKFSGEFGQEIRGMIRSGDPDEVYTGLGVKRAMNMLRSKAAAGVMVDAQDIRELFPAHADKLIKAGGTDAEIGSHLTRLWMKAVAPAIKGREAEILKAVEMGTPDAVEGGREVANFYAAAHRALKKAGVPVGEIPDGQYIPRMFTAEGKEALLAAAEDVPKGTVAHSPTAPFQKHRVTLEELGVSNQAEARALLETLYGNGVFESDLHKISANYMRYADQQLGRQAMLKELKGWGIAHDVGGGESIDDIVKGIVKRKGGRPIPNEPMPFEHSIPNEPMPFYDDPVDLVGPPPQTAEEVVQRALGGADEIPVTPEQPVAPTLAPTEAADPLAFKHAKQAALSAADLRFQRAKLNGLANAVAWGSIDPELAMKMDLDASKRFLAELDIDEMNTAASQYVVQRHLDEGLLRPEDVRTPTRNYAPKYNIKMPEPSGELMDVSSMGDDPSLPYDPTRFQKRGWVPEKYDGTTSKMAQPFDNFTEGDSQWMGDLLQPNPTNADLERLATAAKDEAGQSAVAALTGEATGRVAMKTYEQAVGTRLRHMVTDVMEKRVNLGTGEVGALDDVPLDHLLKEIDASPHSEAMYRQLAAIGKRERQAIAFDENPMEGIGHWEDMSDMDKFDPSNSKTWGTNFDPKAVDTLESVKAAQSMDPAALQRHLDEINGTIEMLNKAFKVLSGAERMRIYEELIALGKDEDEFLRKLWSTEPTDLEMGMAGSREESLAQMFRDIERPDFTWQGKTVSRGEFLGEGNLFPYERGASWTTLTKQRNLADVYLGMQRVAAEQATQGVNIGQEQIAALDNLYAVASSVKDVRMELGGSAFSVPSKDAIQREWIALGINTKPTEEIAVGMLGRNARAFYDNTVEQINDALHSVQTMDPEDPIMAETMKNLQRQRVRMSLAVASGKDSEFIRTMVLQSLEGVGGNELSVTQDAIDSVVRAIMDPTADLTSVLDNLVAPSHPMGGPLPPSNARLMRPLETTPRPQPDLYAESVKAQAAWDAKRAGLEQRKRLIIAASDKRGYTTSAEWDEFKALKQELKEMPERPRAAAVQALADAQAQNERLIAEYDHFGAKIEEMKADGRITRYPDGELGAGDDEAKYALARVREIREQNPWEASGRKPDWLMEDADWADVLGGGKIGMPRNANEAKAPWVARQQEIKTEIEAAKAAGDSKAVKKLAAESRKVQRQLDDIARRYGAADESRKVVPAEVGSTASDAEAFYEGSKLAEQRIKEGRADETLAYIRNKLQSPDLTPTHKARLEGGLKRLEEHAATMDAVEKTVAPKPKASTDMPSISLGGDNFNPLDEFRVGEPTRRSAGSDNMPHGPEQIDDYINRRFWQRQVDPKTGKPFASREAYAQHLLNMDEAAVGRGAKPKFLESTPLGAQDRARVLGIPEAAMAEPEVLADPTPILSGQADDELVARLDEATKAPDATPQAKRVARDTRNWVQNKQRRVLAAVDVAGGDPVAEAAIAAQSQAENAGAERFLRYPTSDPTETFKQLNKLTTVRNLAKLVDDQGSRIVWLQKNQGLVTDEQVAHLLNQVATVSTPEGMRNFLGYYDKFMTYVKAWQLSTPGFHVRNTMGGIFNNFLAGVDIGSTGRFVKNMKAFKDGKLAGEEAEWMKAIYENVGGGQYSHHEIGVAASIKPSKNPFSPRYGPLRASAAFGGDVEFRLRGALMWDRLSKGKSLQEALDDVTRYHFDYSNLSNFESNVVKRIVPFYVWTRYNFPLQMEMMATTPNKYRYYQQFKHSFEDRADSGKPVPSFLTNEMFGIPLPMHSGDNQLFFTPDLPMTRTLGQALPDAENWNPKKLGTYPSLADPYFSQMAVPLKLPAELALSRQFFKGIPIRDTQNTEGYMATKGPLGPVADFIGGKAKTDYLVEQLMPAYGQMRRNLPAEGKHKDRRLTNMLSYIGVPIRTNTPRDQENELMRRQYMEK